jgi:citrate synthase
MSKGAGLAEIIAGQTAVSEITQQSLRYRGYEIADLAAHSTFEEVAYLLLHGELPRRGELEAFRLRVVETMRVPPRVADVLATISHDAPGMDVLRSAVSLLSHDDPDRDELSREANLRKSERLLGDMGKLAQIEGSMPRLTEIPAGCPFHPRCPDAFERCRHEQPELVPVGHSQAACWLHVAATP